MAPYGGSKEGDVLWCTSEDRFQPRHEPSDVGSVALTYRPVADARPDGFGHVVDQLTDDAVAVADLADGDHMALDRDHMWVGVLVDRGRPSPRAPGRSRGR